MRNLLPITEAKALRAAKTIAGWFHTADGNEYQGLIRDAEFLISVLEQYQIELHDSDVVRAQMRIDNDLLNKKMNELKKIINS